MTFKEMAQKFRSVADVMEPMDKVLKTLNGLLHDINETPVTAHTIRTDLRHRKERREPVARKIKAKVKKSKLKLKSARKQHRHHDGLHWTQRPENKEKVAQMIARGTKTRSKAA